jgi:uncharacterized membrane protein (UPF0127 family)
VRLGSLVAEPGARSLLPRVWRAEGHWERARGLLGREALGPQEALLIEPCWLVHTFGMRYALDLAFVDGTGRIRKLAYGVRPGRIAGSVGASQTIECCAGVLAGLALKVGDRVRWCEARP